MSKGKVRLIVNTSNNIRFLTALPAELTIAKALPQLLSKYKAVVRDNLGENHELLEGNWISRVTVQGCLVGREETLGDVVGDGSEIEIEI